MAGLARRSWRAKGLPARLEPVIRTPERAIADDADSAVPLAPDKGLPFGIGDKVGATVANRARSDSLAHEVGRRLRGSNRKQRSRECERRQKLPITTPPGSLESCADAPSGAASISARVMLVRMWSK